MNIDIAWIFLYWGYQLIIYGILGICISRLLGQRTPLDFSLLIRTIFLGVAGLATVLQPLSIISPINSAQHLCVVIAIFCLFGYLMLTSRGTRSLKTIILLPRLGMSSVAFAVAVGCLVSVITLHYATSEIVPYDTGLYHLQNIEILKQFSVVPGLGNLHDRLAYNNSWFLNIAFFSEGPLRNKAFLCQNSFVYLLLMAYILGRLFRRSSFASSPLRFIEMTYFSLALVYFSRYPLFIASVSADTISYILAFFLVSETVFNQSTLSKTDFLEILFIALYCVTVKSSAIFLLLILIPSAVRYFSQHERNLILSMLPLTVIGLFVFVPFAIRGYYLSGYVLFPIYHLDFFKPVWKLAYAHVADHVNLIKGWARSPGANYAESLTQPALVWIPKWWAIYGSQVPLRHFPFILLALPFVAFQFRRLWGLCTPMVKSTFLLFLVHSIWFISAPDPRFSYGSLIAFLLLFLSIAMSFFFRYFCPPHIPSRNGIRFAITVFAFVVPIFAAREHILTMFASPTAEIPKVDLVYRHNSAGAKFATPQPPGDQCWKSDITCTPYFRSDLFYRGPTFQSGFEIKRDESK